MKVLGLIPARAGSKGVPGKNIRLLNSKPLLAYTVEAAFQAKSLTRVVLSTDDEEIANIGQNLGIDVPFTRPAELAQDSSPTLPVVQHALNWLEANNECYDAVCLLQPTNPLRRTQDIDCCVNLLESTGADAVISVLPIPHEHNPSWAYVRKGAHEIRLFTGEAEPIPRRQDLQAAFHRDGSLYVTRKEVIMQQNSLYGSTVVGYEMDPMFSSNIDTEDDWKRVQERIAANEQV